jgi:hypothetical protein
VFGLTIGSWFNLNISCVCLYVCVLWRGGGVEVERWRERLGGRGGERREECYVSDSFYHPALTCVARILLYVGKTFSCVQFIWLLSYCVQLHFIQSLVGYETGASEQVWLRANAKSAVLSYMRVIWRVICFVRFEIRHSSCYCREKAARINGIFLMCLHLEGGAVVIVWVVNHQVWPGDLIVLVVKWLKQI